MIINTISIADEAGWKSIKAPRLTLGFLKDLGRQGLFSRQLRLFACACVRHVGELLEFDQSHHAVDVAERYAGGDASQSELKAAYNAARIPVHSIRQTTKKINSQSLASGGGEVIESWKLLAIDDY